MQHHTSRQAGRAWLRLALISSLVLAGLLAVNLWLARQAAGAPAHSWTTAWAETFEGDFPAGLWTVTNTTQPDGYTWGASAITASQGLSSAWMIGARVTGEPSTFYPPTHTYPNNLSSWMIYGPLTLTGYADVQLSFDVWLDTGPGDYLLVGANIYTGTAQLPGPGLSGTLWLPGTILSGTGRAWQAVTIPLKRVAGQADVWISFGFISDDDGQAGSGAFVDNIQLQARRHHVYLPLIFKRHPPIPFAPILSIDPVDDNGAYSVRWQPQGSAPVLTYTLHEARDLLFNVDLTIYSPGSATSQPFNHGGAPGPYCYRVRGYNTYGAGNWSQPQCTSVYPGAPTLNPIDNPDQLPYYTLLWSAGRGAASYQLEQASTAAFTDTQQIYAGVALSHSLSHQAMGDYYYRARSMAGELASPWSNVVSTTVSTLQDYFDDFSNPNSGWWVTDTMTYTISYQPNGTYQIYVPLDFRGGGNVDTWFVKPVVLAPVQPPAGSPYCVSMDAYFYYPYAGWWANYGIVFGSLANKGTFYSLETNANGKFAVLKHRVYEFPYSRYSDWLVEWQYDWEIPGLVISEFGRNHFMVSVNGNWVEFFINGIKVSAIWISGMPEQAYVGVIGGPYEVTPIDSRFDNFMWSIDAGACPKGTPLEPAQRSRYSEQARQRSLLER